MNDLPAFWKAPIVGGAPAELITATAEPPMSGMIGCFWNKQIKAPLKEITFSWLGLKCFIFFLKKECTFQK